MKDKKFIFISTVNKEFKDGTKRHYLLFKDQESGDLHMLYENKKFNLFIGPNSSNIAKLECYEVLKRGSLNSVWEFKKSHYEITKEGYILIRNKVKDEFFHRMVVFAFGDKDENFPKFSITENIDHINGDKLNCFTSLEYNKFASFLQIPA